MTIRLIAETNAIRKRQKKLSRTLKVKIRFEGNEVILEGKAEDEYIAEKVIEAINMGFPISTALEIKEKDFLFEALNMKDYTKKRDFQRIRARIIGTRGRVLRTLCDLTNCNFEVKDSFAGIIGAPEYLQNAQNAIISIIRGAKHSNVYSFLEKHRIKPVVDFALKPVKKKK